MKLKRKQFALLGAALLVVALGFFIFFTRNNNDTSPDSDTETNQNNQSIDHDEDTPLTPNNEIEQDNQAEVDNPRPEDGEPSKDPVTIVTEKPLIYTGYGHNQLKPLPSGQKTSTTCTSDPNVKCYITAKKANSSEVVVFETMTTDSEGVARWTWTGGEKLPSGTWKLVATAGDKSSNTETIYIK